MNEDRTLTREAVDRAEALLREHLDDEQRESWEREKSFEVEAQSGRCYRVGAAGVRALDDGSSYCLQPAEGTYPLADIALARKLWLEADEAGFLEQANCFAPGPFFGHRRSEADRHLLDAQAAHQRRLEALHRDFRERVCDEERRFHDEVEAIRRRNAEGEGEFYQILTGPSNCRSDIVFREACRPRELHLETLEQAREWMEGQGWEAQVNIDRNDFPALGECGPRWTTYEVNGLASDERTVELLRQAAIERGPTPVTVE